MSNSNQTYTFNVMFVSIILSESLSCEEGVNPPPWFFSRGADGISNISLINYILFWAIIYNIIKLTYFALKWPKMSFFLTFIQTKAFFQLGEGQSPHTAVNAHWNMGQNVKQWRHRIGSQLRLKMAKCVTLLLRSSVLYCQFYHFNYWFLIIFRYPMVHIELTYLVIEI